MSKFINGPVYPIPPSFKEDGSLDLEQVKNYLSYLSESDVKTAMTTAGTSQFNLMSLDEIRQFNKCCVENFPGKVIVGLPALPSCVLSKEIWHTNHLYGDNDRVALMLLYPDRHYDNKDVVSFFHQAADDSRCPIFIHGMFMRKGQGGTFDFDAKIVNEIAAHPYIIGMKEECTSFEKGYDLCRGVKKKNIDFEIIVAGKSIRRWVLMKTAGADTFLAGLGSIFPKFDADAYHFRTFDSVTDVAYKILKVEDHFFDTCMKIGWHLSFREILKQLGVCCLYNRSPFPVCTKKQSKELGDILEYIRKSLSDIG